MANYKDIKGTTVQVQSGTQPTTYPQAAGELYYNSSNGDYEFLGPGAGAWSSGGNLNTNRRYASGLGSVTAGLVFGGANPGTIDNTESYNGTAWTEENDLNAGQVAMASAGTSTSGMSALGATSPNTRVEDWNGTSWSSNPHSLNAGRQFPGGDGPSNDSALMVGGEPSPNGALTEIYDGSSWTEVGDLNTGRNQLAASGTTTALIAVGGYQKDETELWNGTAWTEVSDLNTGRGGMNSSGSSTAALAFGGDPVTAKTEEWNGSAWTETNDLATARKFGASSNITGATSAFLASGEEPSIGTATEEWTISHSVKTVTTS